MIFRFISAIVLIVVVSIVGITLEKQNLKLRRSVSRQHYRMDVLRERHARLRLQTQELGAPVRIQKSIEKGQLDVETPRTPVDETPRRIPLLRWQRPEP